MERNQQSSTLNESESPEHQAWEEIRELIDGEDSPLVISTSDVEEFLFVDTTTQNLFHEQQRIVEDWISSPGAAPHAMILMDVSQPADSRIFLRGNSSNPGDLVPRQFLRVLTRGNRVPFQQGSGRLELARSIASRENPLTARVLVNRLWMHHLVPDWFERLAILVFGESLRHILIYWIFWRGNSWNMIGR